MAGQAFRLAGFLRFGGRGQPTTNNPTSQPLAANVKHMHSREEAGAAGRAPARASSAAVLVTPLAATAPRKAGGPAAGVALRKVAASPAGQRALGPLPCKVRSVA